MKQKWTVKAYERKNTENLIRMYTCNVMFMKYGPWILDVDFHSWALVLAPSFAKWRAKNVILRKCEFHLTWLAFESGVHNMRVHCFGHFYYYSYFSESIKLFFTFHVFFGLALAIAFSLVSCSFFGFFLGEIGLFCARVCVCVRVHG